MTKTQACCSLIKALGPDIFWNLEILSFRKIKHVCSGHFIIPPVCLGQHPAITHINVSSAKHLHIIQSEVLTLNSLMSPLVRFFHQMKCRNLSVLGALWILELRKRDCGHVAAG